MHESNLKIAKYSPLTFQCVHCDQQFALVDNSLEKLSADVSEHLAVNHPEILHPELPGRRGEDSLGTGATQVA